MDVHAILAELNEENSHIIIYGAGKAGRKCVNFFNSSDKYTINCFLDKNADIKPNYMGYPVYKPNDATLSADFRRDALVVLALILNEDEYGNLQNELRTLGYTKFINAFHQLGRLALPFDDSSSLNRNFFIRESDKIEAAFNLMSDEHSQQVFFSVFSAHAKINYKLPTQSVGMTQYLNVDIPFRHQYRAFADCGAFTGDTLKELAARYKVEQYFGFEPDVKNFAQLSQHADALSSVNRAVLLPVGVGETNEFLRFHAMGESSSRIDETGDCIIQIARLDDLLKGYDNLMIKMDVEGAEIAALNGAKRIIAETKPDLAICVYHRVSDMWAIPLMLKEWVPEYKFYMRNHFQGTMETVLYATIC
jgi:FkbM family methyltransferase